MSLKKEDVFLIDRSEIGFRLGTVSQIVGIHMVSPDGFPPRLCYHLRWSDGQEDWKPIDDPESVHDIGTKSDLLETMLSRSKNK